MRRRAAERREGKKKIERRKVACIDYVITERGVQP